MTRKFLTPLVLPADPAAALEAATKQYVDARATPTAWVNATLQNGWTNDGGIWQVAQYRKIGDIVYLRASVSNGTANVPIFTLPVGFRPLKEQDLLVAGYAGAARTFVMVYVSTDGTVNPETNAGISLAHDFAIT